MAAVPNIKQESITISMEDGKGTIQVCRPQNKNKYKKSGVLAEFTYTGNGSMAIMDALAAARRKLEETIATADAKAGTAQPKAPLPVSAPASTVAPEEGDASLPTVPEEEDAEPAAEAEGENSSEQEEQE
jgi:hypothetical protein